MMRVAYKYTLGFLVFGSAFVAGSILGYRQGFDQGSSVALCLVSTFQKGVQKQGLDMASPSCQEAKQGEAEPLWHFRKRHQAKDQPHDQ